MLVATILGFLTPVQVRQNAGGLSLPRWTAFVVAFATDASLVLTIVDGPLLDLLKLPLLQSWGILGLDLLAGASFASLMAVLIGRWAVLPTWLFFVVFGNTFFGGAVAPPCPLRRWHFSRIGFPRAPTVTSLREADYFPWFQHVQPITVLGTWATLLLQACS